MASSSPDASSSQTTSTRSIITLDGYISSGKAPTSSEVLRDHAMLQDFVAYLELRLKSQNLSMLRRIFADFLNEHEYTLIPMMHQGCTIITIFPVERTSARRRRQAEFLLSKPKFHLNFSRGCVFLYLQYRTATRNMALLKHLFLEFIGQRETSLLAFVERGCQVISVIPFELPRIAPPARLLPPQLEQRASPCAVENVAGQEQTTSEVAGVEKTKKNEVAVSNTRQRQSSTARADVAEQQPSEQRPEERRSHSVVKTRIEPPAAVVLNGSEIVTRRRQKRTIVASTAGSSCSRDNKATNVPLNSNDAAVLTLKRGRTITPGTVNPEAGDVPPQQPPASEQREASPAVASPTKAPQTEAPTEVLSDSQPKRRRGRDNVTDEKRSRKRGKPFMTEEMCRNQLDLTRKIGILEAQSPWKTSHGNLPAPFDAERYPELARKFSRFWRKHVHAVWERKFWAPMSRKLCLPAFNKRNNRQLMAKNAFELLIVSVYEEFGAAFFVEIDALKERHPGWWYRGPVVALFALQQIKGEDTMWDYVNNQAFLRFPDCNLPIPLTAANSGAVRIGHKRESESMWMVNHQLTAGILHEIAALKAEKQAHEQELASQITTIEHDRDVENETALVEALELM
ncbi:hypothetical protein DD238_002179 [Peronospora effusa]|uniref:Uncharacterized protein n=1 Tax=Peronospora effusa TaxID=542832 RepID=A0A3M6VQW6_9STRA|nr:hypothetical protein DD238_002179 [Peronospora effusa]